MPELPNLRCAWSWEDNSGGELLRSIFNWTLKDTFPEFSCCDLYVFILLLFTSVYLWQEVDHMSMSDAEPTANHEMTEMVWGKSESSLPTEDSLPSPSSRNHTCYLNKVFVWPNIPVGILGGDEHLSLNLVKKVFFHLTLHYLLHCMSVWAMVWGGGWEQLNESWFFPSAVWVPGIELRSSGLVVLLDEPSPWSQSRLRQTLRDREAMGGGGACL